jgi:NAD(P)-dependent dehydrogenase (short-subunit alcohol dehydrogenase family)
MGRTAIVTGATRGLRREIAIALTAQVAWPCGHMQATAACLPAAHLAMSDRYMLEQLITAVALKFTTLKLSSQMENGS